MCRRGCDGGKCGKQRSDGQEKGARINTEELIGNRFPSLRGVGPEFETRSSKIYGLCLPDWAEGVKHPFFREEFQARAAFLVGQGGMPLEEFFTTDPKVWL